MLKYYLKIAIRSLTKQEGYAFLNIVGQAVGLACFILILLFVQHELSYDRFYEKSERIYRVVQRQPGSVYLESDRFAVTPASLAGLNPDRVGHIPAKSSPCHLGSFHRPELLFKHLF